jgi:hypothetical protein
MGGTSATGAGLSSPQLIAWRSGLKGIDRASLCYSTSSSGGDGSEKDEEEKKEYDDDDGKKKEA